MSNQLAQEQLQNALVTTFLANLSFLNEFDNVLFQRVESLSQSINSGEYKENYELEFLEDVGEFDIYDVKNDKYLYDKKAQRFNKNALAKVDFTSKGSISVLDNELFQGRWYNVFDDVEYFCNFEYANKKLVNDILNYSKVLRNNINDYRVKKYKYINKFVFMGTLLGRHIPLIVDKIKAKNFFVCEQNLEIFRLSLFVVDYTILVRDDRKVVFSIMDDEHHYLEKLESFFSSHPYENYCIKYFTTDMRVESYYNSLINFALAHRGTTFNHYMMLENVWKNVSERINKYKTLQLLQKTKNDILDKPLLFIGAGPSFGENLEWVKENRNKFIVVAILATTKTLFDNGITPDIVITLDPQYHALNWRQFDYGKINKIDNVNVFAAINTDQRILNRFDKDKLYLFETLKPLHKNNICHKGFSVGEIGASLLLELGFKNIYFLGLDFALNQKTGASHIDSYSPDVYNDFKESKDESKEEKLSFKEDLIELKGNHLEKVYTNRLFALSLDAMGSNVSMIKKEEQKVYNLSAHGAYIENTIPLKIEDLDLSYFEELERQFVDEVLNQFLNEVSRDTLSKNDYADLQKELEYINKVEKTFSDFLENKSLDFKEFYKKCEKMVNLIFYPEVPCSCLYMVFKNFFAIILQYVFYCFNDKKIKKEKQKLEQIEKQFIEDSLELLKKYKEYLEAI